VATRRIQALVGAGLVDSFGLALGWTTFNLYAAGHGGLEAVGFYGAALLAGIALSAPTTTALCRHLTGRQLLRAAAVGEAVARVASLVLLVLDASPLLVAACVVASGMTAWTGFATMRAEVAAANPGSRSMTRYMGSVAAVEGVGAAIAAILPAGAVETLTGPGFVAVLFVYAVSLAPTFVVARGAQVGKAARTRKERPKLDLDPLVGGFLVMLFGSAPTFLAVGLSAELHGRRAVPVAAMAFAVGAVLAPSLASLLERRRVPTAAVWPVLGVAMVTGWVAAPSLLVGLALAQFLSGLALSTFEGAMDSGALRASGCVDTASLARTAAARALGSAVAVASAPTIIGATGLPLFSVLAGSILAVAALAAFVRALLRRSGTADVAASPAAQSEALSTG
jgi:hypothetical protein